MYIKMVAASWLHLQYSGTGLSWPLGDQCCCPQCSATHVAFDKPQLLQDNNPDHSCPSCYGYPIATPGQKHLPTSEPGNLLALSIWKSRLAFRVFCLDCGFCFWYNLSLYLPLRCWREGMCKFSLILDHLCPPPPKH